jgi:hypothetical protein
VYPVGVLSIYFYTLYCNRKDIRIKDYDEVEIQEMEEKDRLRREEYIAHHGTDVGFVSEMFVRPEKGFMKYITKTELNFLHKAYEGRCWYWEVVETCRRLLLTAVASVVAAGSSSQIVFSIFVAVLYIKLYGYFHPFEMVSYKGDLYHRIL